ncbi:two-partner secretion domain-containing protein [Nostoc sp.]
MSFKTAPNWLQGLLGVAIVSAVTLYANISVAQITPDGTLPNNSNVKLEGNTRIIEGGTIRGGNLFHSFGEFSVLNGSTALFNNSLDIQNILTRVTGKSISNIDGLIRANGKANLFLLNPNGIIFGKNASLNIGGSFVATTANAIGFGNLGFFSASNPEAPSPLLTVNPNALLFNQIATSMIQNSSTAPAGKDPANLDAFGLRVPDGQSLLLVGGNVNMDGGQLNAYGGQVELGGLASSGTVALGIDGNNFRLGFPAESPRTDVSLANKSSVHVETAGGGSIAVNARNLEISGKSVLHAGIGQGLGSVNSVAGDITLDATGKIKVVGEGSNVFNGVRSQAVGNGGNLTVNTLELLIRDGAQVSTGTFGAGKSGNLKINAKTVEVIGSNTVDGSSSQLTTGTDPSTTGNGGDLTITTKTLLVRDGAQVGTGTFGAGKSGNLKVNAETVELIGINAVDGSPGGLFTNSDRGATGNGGNITINSNELLVQDGALIFTGARAGRKSPSNGGDITITTQKLLLQKGGVGAATRGAGRGGNVSVKADIVQLNGFPAAIYSDTDSTGDAGNLTINTKILTARNGAQVNTGTAGAGKGGNLTVNADTVQVIGTSTEGSTGRFRSGLFSSTLQNSTGAAGDLKINAQQLLVRDKAGVFVQSLGTGIAGNLFVNARSIRLDNGIISANTRSINTDPNELQATITLQVKDILLLGRGSKITTNAKGENVIGGDININTNIFAAFENSDITANSDDFRGGNVRINTKGIFGIQFRDIASPNTNDITATGATRELSGNVQINTPDVDPTRGLVELPTNLVDASRQISTACTPGTRQFQNTFVATGRGGLPISPTEPLQDSSTVSAWVRLRAKPENLANTTPVPQPTAVSTTPKIAATTPIVEASGWVINRNGNIELVAQVPQVNPHSPWQTPASCPVSQ